MKKNNSFKSYAISFIIITLLFLLFKIIAFALPDDKIRFHIRESVDSIASESNYRVPFIGTNFKTDNYTDATILNISMNMPFYNEKNSLIKNSISDNFFYDRFTGGGINDLKNVSENNLLSNNKYYRYWHGNQTIIRPLLLFFNYSEIRMILTLITSVLLVIVYSLISKLLDVKYSVALAVSYSFMYINFSSMSLQYSAMTILSLVSIILVCLLYKYKKGEKVPLLFFTLGALTAYYDFLTFPLVTYGLPMIITLLFEFKNENSFIRRIILIIKTGLLWIISYGCTFLSKWIITSIILKKNVILGCFKAFLIRSDLSSSEPISKIEAFKVNQNMYFDNIAIYLLIVIFIFWLILFKYRKNIKEGLLLILISITPYMWYFILTQHSYMHQFFTNKSLVITMFGLISFFIFTTNFNKLKKDALKIKSKIS